MSWRHKPTKDAEGCDKPRVAAKQASTRGSPNGKPVRPNRRTSMAEFIGHGRQRGELKYFSTRRKGKKTLDFPSSCERKGTSLNRPALRAGVAGTVPGPARRVTKAILAEGVWKAPPQQVIVL